MAATPANHRKRSRSKLSKRDTAEPEVEDVEAEAEDQEEYQEGDIQQGDWFASYGGYNPMWGPQAWASGSYGAPQGYFGMSPGGFTPSKANGSGNMRNNKRPSSGAKLKKRQVFDNNQDEGDDSEPNDGEEVKEHYERPTKRRTPKASASWHHPDASSYSSYNYPTVSMGGYYPQGPAGLQPPNLGSLPFASMPPMWSPYPQATPSSTPDSATLWAYYYYGYAMGQYDAFNMKKRRYDEADES